MVASAALMNPLMARYAERHQIALVMCAAVREGLDVMHELRDDVSALLFAFLAERIPRQVSISNPAPYATIPLVLIVPTREVVIVPLHRFLVLLAITAFSICKIRASCHAAGTLRLSRHRFTSSTASKKPSRRIASPRRLIP